LPAATSSVDCNSNNPSGGVTGASQCSLQGASVSIAAYPNPTLTTSVDDAQAVATQDALADFDYYFEVIGGTSGDVVPILVQTTLSTSASYPDYAYAELRVGGQDEMVCTDGSCGASEFDGTLSLTASVGTAVEVHLRAGSEESYSAGGDVSASADPYIYIDPTFANAGQYSIEVSSGAGNSLAAVPEPASWIVMLGGLGLAGCVMRGRRKALAPST
jgi:hypothetical protein